MVNAPDFALWDAPSAETARRRSVDVVDDVLFVAPAIRSAVRDHGVPLTLSQASTSWTRYAMDVDRIADWVVVRAELRDHVPPALKVRALTRVDARTVVLANTPSAAHIARLMESGAHAVLTHADDFDKLLAVLLGKSIPSAPAGAAGIRLSDRELQVACLFAGRTAPSTAVLARLLRLPHASVRTHLQRARATLSVLGPASTRDELHDRLVENGWLFPEL